jgi:hypothetical protein
MWIDFCYFWSLIRFLLTAKWPALHKMISSAPFNHWTWSNTGKVNMSFVSHQNLWRNIWKVHNTNGQCLLSIQITHMIKQIYIPYCIMSAWITLSMWHLVYNLQSYHNCIPFLIPMKIFFPLMHPILILSLSWLRLYTHRHSDVQTWIIALYSKDI